MDNVFNINDGEKYTGKSKKQARQVIAIIYDDGHVSYKKDRSCWPAISSAIDKLVDWL